MDKFWRMIDLQLHALTDAKTAADVVNILGGKTVDASGDAFFAGGGGDELPDGPLLEAGWRMVKEQAPYYWVMQAPNGDLITYVEGDIYVGDVMSEED